MRVEFFEIWKYETYVHSQDFYSLLINCK